MTEKRKAPRPYGQTKNDYQLEQHYIYVKQIQQQKIQRQQSKMIHWKKQQTKQSIINAWKTWIKIQKT